MNMTSVPTPGATYRSEFVRVDLPDSFTPCTGGTSKLLSACHLSRKVALVAAIAEMTVSHKWFRRLSWLSKSIAIKAGAYETQIAVLELILSEIPDEVEYHVTGPGYGTVMRREAGNFYVEAVPSSVAYVGQNPDLAARSPVPLPRVFRVERDATNAPKIT